MKNEQTHEVSKLTELFSEFYQNIEKSIPKLDPQLAVKIMLLEMNLKDYVGAKKPHVNLSVQYKEGTDLGRKQEEARDKYPIEVTVNKWQDGVIFSGLMSISNVETICSDPDIIKVSGKASPRHN